jgi:hypothetical protein
MLDGLLKKDRKLVTSLAEVFTTDGKEVKFAERLRYNHRVHSLLTSFPKN